MLRVALTFANESVIPALMAVLMDLLNAPVLVLNRYYQAVRITTVRRALMMMYVGAARALGREYETYDFNAWASNSRRVDGEFIRTSSGRLRAPRLLVLSRYGRLPTATLRLSRRNILLRDKFTCQYCGSKPPLSDLDIDHVTPRSRGGISSWQNLVTACRTCNLRKGNATPEEAAMELLNKPHRPNWTASIELASVPRYFSEWEPFLASVPGCFHSNHTGQGAHEELLGDSPPPS
jgi:hypothetical protein